MIYLDNPATSIKKPPIVYEAMYKYTKNYSVNAGRGSHIASIRGAEGISKAQEALANLFNIKTPERIAFTQNATYALNMAIGGFLTPRDHAIITSMEHNSVLRPVHRICGKYDERLFLRQRAQLNRRFDFCFRRYRSSCRIAVFR